MICKTCGKEFDPADSLMGDLGQCQECWEEHCDKTWWEMHDSLALATEKMERDALIGNAYTTSAGQPFDQTLTFEKVQQTYNAIQSMHIAQMENPFWPTPSPLMANGLPVYTTRYMGKTVYPRPPAMPRGPYLQRRYKRWHRAHPPYTVGDGQYFLIEDRAIVCHPDDLPKLTEALNAREGNDHVGT